MFVYRFFFDLEKRLVCKRRIDNAAICIKKLADMKNIRYFFVILFLAGIPVIFSPQPGCGLLAGDFSPSGISHFSGVDGLRSSSSSVFGQPPPTYPSLYSLLFLRLGYDVGILAGTSHSLTNIGTGLPSFMGTHWETTDLNAGAFFRYRFDLRWAVTTSFHYARMHAADSLAPTETARFRRDFYFNNEIFELNVVLEHFLPPRTYTTPWDIYGFVGFGVFHHDPDLTVPDPDNYEKESFSQIQPAIPMGVGVMYALNENFRIAFDIGHRITFTDHIDGFSRPASDADDAYFLGSLRVSYFFTPRRFIPY